METKHIWRFGRRYGKYIVNSILIVTTLLVIAVANLLSHHGMIGVSSENINKYGLLAIIAFVAMLLRTMLNDAIVRPGEKVSYEKAFNNVCDLMRNGPDYRVYGFAGVDRPNPDRLIDEIRNLEKGDELLWMNTYSHFATNLMPEIISAINTKDITIRLLLLKYDGKMCRMRGEEVTRFDYDAVSLSDDEIEKKVGIYLRNARHYNEAPIVESHGIDQKRRENLQVRFYDELIGSPILIVKKPGKIYGYIGFYLGKPASESIAIKWSSESSDQNLFISDMEKFFDYKWKRASRPQ